MSAVRFGPERKILPESVERDPVGVPKRPHCSALLALGDGPLAVPPHLPALMLVPKSFDGAITATLSSGSAICCAIVHVAFGGGRGLDLIPELRAIQPLMPILLLTSKSNKRVLSLVHAHDVELVTREWSSEIIGRFVKQSAVRKRATFDQLEAYLEEMARHQNLTPTELRIAMAVTRGMTRSELLASFDVSVNTLKSQTRNILKKTGHASLAELSRVALTGLFSDAA